MSVSIIPRETLASVSRYIASWCTDGKNANEVGNRIQAPLSVMKGFSEIVVDDAEIDVNGLSMEELSQRIYTHIRETNMQAFNRAYPDLGDQQLGNDVPSIEAFSGSEYAIPHSEAGYAYLISALNLVSHGVTPQSDGEIGRLPSLIDQMHTMSGYALHSYRSTDMLRPHHTEVAESINRLMEHGHHLFDTQSGLRGVIDRLSVDTRHGQYAGKDILMHLYYHATQQSQRVDLPDPNDYFSSSMPRVELISVASVSPNRYALSGDVPLPDENDIHRLIEATRYVCNYLQWLPEGGVCHPDGVSFDKDERKALFNNVTALRSDLSLSGQRFLCVYDGSLSAENAFAKREAYVLRDKTAYIVGDVAPNSPGHVVLTPLLDDNQKALLRLTGQSGVYLMTDQSEVDKLGPGYTDTMLSIPVSKADIDVLTSRWIRPVDATTVRLIDIMETLEAEKATFSDPSLSVDEQLSQIDSALKNNGFFNREALLDEMRSALDTGVGHSPDTLVQHTYPTLSYDQKSALHFDEQAPLSSTLERLASEGVEMSRPKR